MGNAKDYIALAVRQCDLLHRILSIQPRSQRRLKTLRQRQRIEDHNSDLGARKGVFYYPEVPRPKALFNAELAHRLSANVPTAPEGCVIVPTWVA